MIAYDLFYGTSKNSLLKNSCKFLRKILKNIWADSLFIIYMGQFSNESVEIYPSIYIWGLKSLIT